MQLIEKSLPASGDANVFLIGDWHIGLRGFHDRGAQKILDMIAGEYCDVRDNMVIGIGDYIEARPTDHKYFELSNSDPGRERPFQQITDFIELVFPLKKKIITLLEGNHEAGLSKQMEYVRYACQEIGAPYGTYESVVTFALHGKAACKFFVCHGFGSIGSRLEDPKRRQVNREIALRRKLSPLAGDCVVSAMGHIHQVIVCEPDEELFLTSNGKRLVQHYTKIKQLPDDGSMLPINGRWYVSTGSMLRQFVIGESTYASRAGYVPAELGHAVVRIRGGAVVGVDKIHV